MDRLSVQFLLFAGLICYVSSMAAGPPGVNHGNPWNLPPYPPPTQPQSPPWGFQAPPNPPNQYGAPPIVPPMFPDPSNTKPPTPNVGGKPGGGHSFPGAGAAPGAASLGAINPLMNPLHLKFLKYNRMSLEAVCAQNAFRGTGFIADEIGELAAFRFTPRKMRMGMLTPGFVKQQVGTGPWACAFTHYQMNGRSIGAAFSDLVDSGCNFACNPIRGPYAIPPGMALLRAMGGGAGALLQGLGGGPLAGLNPMMPPGPPPPQPSPPQGGPVSWGGIPSPYPWGPPPPPSHSPVPGFNPNIPNNIMGKPFPQASMLGAQHRPTPQVSPNNPYQPQQPTNPYQPQPPKNPYRPQPPNNPYPPQPPNNQYSQQNNNQYPPQQYSQMYPTGPSKPVPSPPSAYQEPNPYRQGPNQYQQGPDPFPPGPSAYPQYPVPLVPPQPPARHPNHTQPKPEISIHLPGSSPREDIVVEEAVAVELRKMSPIRRKLFVMDALVTYMKMIKVGPPSPYPPNQAPPPMVGSQIQPPIIGGRGW